MRARSAILGAVTLTLAGLACGPGSAVAVQRAGPLIVWGAAQGPGTGQILAARPDGSHRHALTGLVVGQNDDNAHISQTADGSPTNGTWPTRLKYS